MTDIPVSWMDDLVEHMESFIECTCAGSLDIRFGVDEPVLHVAPELLELAGGMNDGEEVFPMFTIDVSALLSEFDEGPDVRWDTMQGELSIDGTIDGDEAIVILRQHPFDDVTPTGQVVDGEILRPR